MFINSYVAPFAIRRPLVRVHPLPAAPFPSPAPSIWPFLSLDQGWAGFVGAPHPWSHGVGNPLPHPWVNGVGNPLPHPWLT